MSETKEKYSTYPGNTHYCDDAEHSGGWRLLDANKCQKCYPCASIEALVTVIASMEQRIAKLEKVV